MQKKMKEKFTRYEQDVIMSAKANHIWLNGFACIKPSDDLLIQIGRAVLHQLNNDENLILSDFDDSPFESLKGKELILRINKS